jgi:hypothetical protein
MRSIRKISLLAAVVAVAIAAAAPAAASATKLEIPAGQLASSTAKLIITSTNPTFTTTWGNLHCKEVTLPSRVTQNYLGIVKVAADGLGSSSYCNINGNPFTLEPELRGLTLISPQSGTMDLQFKIKYPGMVSCVVERTDIPVTYTAGSSEFGVTMAKMNAFPSACAPFYLSAKFKLASVSIPGTPVLN